MRNIQFCRPPNRRPAGCGGKAYRWANGVPLTDSDDALKVNWCGVTVTDDAGKILYHNAFITDWQISPGNVAGLVAAGRARRKIANENNNGRITECLRETACTAARHC